MGSNPGIVVNVKSSSGVTNVKSQEIRESKDVLASVVGLRLNIFHIIITGAFSTKQTRGFLA